MSLKVWIILAFLLLPGAWQAPARQLLGMSEAVAKQEELDSPGDDFPVIPRHLCHSRNVLRCSGMGEPIGALPAHISPASGPRAVPSGAAPCRARRTWGGGFVKQGGKTSSPQGPQGLTGGSCRGVTAKTKGSPAPWGCVHPISLSSLLGHLKVPAGHLCTQWSLGHGVSS